MYAVEPDYLLLLQLKLKGVDAVPLPGGLQLQGRLEHVIKPFRRGVKGKTILRGRQNICLKALFVQCAHEGRGEGEWKGGEMENEREGEKENEKEGEKENENENEGEKEKKV